MTDYEKVYNWDLKYVVFLKGALEKVIFYSISSLCRQVSYMITLNRHK